MCVCPRPEELLPPAAASPTEGGRASRNTDPELVWHALAPKTLPQRRKAEEGQDGQAVLVSSNNLHLQGSGGQGAFMA